MAHGFYITFFSLDIATEWAFFPSFLKCKKTSVRFFSWNSAYVSVCLYFCTKKKVLIYVKACKRTSFWTFVSFDDLLIYFLGKRIKKKSLFADSGSFFLLLNSFQCCTWKVLWWFILQLSRYKSIKIVKVIALKFSNIFTSKRRTKSEVRILYARKAYVSHAKSVCNIALQPLYWIGWCTVNTEYPKQY